MGKAKDKPDEKKPGGRPTKFDAEKGKLITERLRVGGTRKDAAESVGVWYNTFLGWMKRGEKATTGEFREFWEAATQAEAECVLRNVAILEKAANGYDAGEITRTTKTVFRTKRTKYPDGTVVVEPVPFQETTEQVVSRREFDWRAALEFLKRRRPSDWSEKFVQELTGPNGLPLVLGMTENLSRDELRELLHAARQDLAAGGVPVEP